jgi:pSer/pThr/pTyr-binding forkhead associated (FHA) protein
VEDVFCHNCGHRNPAGVNFCSSCGAALAQDEPSDTTITLQVVEHDPAEDDDVVALVEVPHGTDALVVKRGPNMGARYLLDHELVRAGRHPESDIFLDDITVSRRHADLERAADGRMVIRDAGSLNGTYVNRERIEQQVTLAAGDEVQIGKFKLVYLISGEA